MITDEMLCVAAGMSLEAYVSYLESDYDSSNQHVFSDEFEKKMRKLIRKAKHPAFYRAAKRIAVILLAALLSTGVWLSVDTQARAAFFGWVKGMYENFFAYRYSGEDAEIENEYAKPVWIPDGYVLLFEEDTGDQFFAMYSSEKRGMLSFSCIYKPGKADVFLKAENADVSYVPVGPYIADLLHFEGGEEADAIMWTDNRGSAYVISGYLTEEELEKVANSLYKK